MEQRHFPSDFLWGAATSGHQVEGNNTNTDWWAWETDPAPRHKLAEPSGLACDHFHRYRDDIGRLAALGLTAFRFSVEWARVEPAEGQFDPDALAHYADMVSTCVRAGISPIVTLQHFTLPLWVAAKGGWCATDMPMLFARYAARVCAALGSNVRYVCTVNEPGNLLTRGYLGTFPAPPFLRDLSRFDRAAAGLAAAHCAARDAVRAVQPGVRVGMAYALQDWQSTPAGQPFLEFVQEVHEDRYFDACDDDDFLGLQTYTRIENTQSRLEGAVVSTLLRSRWLTDKLLLPLIHREALKTASGENAATSGKRCTEMGYLWAPEAIDATARRIAARFPGKENLITEHGIATNDDSERIEYVSAALEHIHNLIADGVPITGYLHWSLLDNWEWWDGFAPKFGLFSVDRTTQERSARPSAHWLGSVARANALPTQEPDLTPVREIA